MTKLNLLSLALVLILLFSLNGCEKAPENTEEDMTNGGSISYETLDGGITWTKSELLKSL